MTSALTNSILWHHRAAVWHGLRVTFEVTAIGYAGAVLLGFALCIMLLYMRPLKPLARFLVEFFRATPIYVQLLWVNYVWPTLIGWPHSAFEAAYTALAIQSAGYLAETFRAGIENVHKGHIDAGRAQGMSGWLIMRRIVLPEAAQAMAPSFMNQLLVVLKSSTLVAVIAVPDLMYQALRLNSVWFEPIEIFSSIAAIYIVLVSGLSWAFKAYTDRLRERYGLTMR